MRPPGAIVFDLDGTLADTRRDLAAAVNRARAGLGLAPLPLAQVASMVGEGARRLVERALPEAAEATAFEAAFESFLGHYDRLCLETTRLYPGVEEMLRRLGRRFPLALLTNKPEALSRRIVEGLGLGRCFAALVGGDSLPSRKPDPEGLHWLAARLAAPVAELLLVGDSRVDAATARAAGCPFALVEWGFATAEERAGIDADLRLPHPGALTAALVG